MTSFFLHFLHGFTDLALGGEVGPILRTRETHCGGMTLHWRGSVSSPKYASTIYLRAASNDMEYSDSCSREVPLERLEQSASRLLVVQ